MTLTATQLVALAARFPFFDAARCAPFFAAEQPEDSALQVGERHFPGVRLTNGAFWFYDRELRPEGRDGAPMKVKARSKYRTPISDDPEQPELLVVEGEGHACACVSVGLRGVVVAGGTQGFLAAAGAEKRRTIFGGKSVRILFDADEPGQKGAIQVAREVLRSGAARVAIVTPPFAAGQDVEDWLAAFDSPELALGSLVQAVSATDWAGAAELAAADGDVVHVHSQAVTGRDGQRRVALFVWDEPAQRASLAVLGDATEPAPSAGRSIQHDVEPEPDPVQAIGEGWALLERWTFEGTTYAPDVRGDMMKQIIAKALIPPAPPIDPGPSEQLWADLRAFYQRWLAIEPRYYDVCVAYCLMTYRLQDAGFDFVPYLRFFGPSGTGKGRACDAMRVTCFRGFSAKPTKSNLHRVVDMLGDITLIIDEFHLDRGRNEQNEEMVDLLNFGNKASELVLRMEPEKSGKGMLVRSFSLFGPKILAGYGTDEHEALARRSISIEMGQTEVPESMRRLNLPPEFYAAAYELRRRLLGWRARKLALGRPTGQLRERMLLDRAGHAVGQVFWPLIEMVPETDTDALENLLGVAAERKAAAAATREASTDAYVVAAVAELWAANQRTQVKSGSWVVSTDSLLAHMGRHVVNGSDLVGRVRAAGLRHGRGVAPSGGQITGVVIHAPEDSMTEAAMRRFGIPWPPGSSAAPI